MLSKSRIRFSKLSSSSSSSIFILKSFFNSHHPRRRLRRVGGRFFSTIPSYDDGKDEPVINKVDVLCVGLGNMGYELACRISSDDSYGNVVQRLYFSVSPPYLSHKRNHNQTFTRWIPTATNTFLTPKERFNPPDRANHQLF